MISDSGPVGTDAGTVKLPSATASSEIETSVLPHSSTTPEVNRPTAPTTVLPAQQTPGATQAISKRKPRKAILAMAGVIAVALIAGLYLYSSRAKKAAPIESIAVMPFQNKNSDADTEYLSDGLADSLIYRLSQLPNLKVSPTSSVFRYKGKDTDLAQIAKELEVDAVMSGRVSQRGDNLTINVELIDTRTKKLLWVEQYDRKMTGFGWLRVAPRRNKPWTTSCLLYEAKYAKATECLAKDRDTLLTFYDFPAEHWIHIRTTNPIESTFATVRLRTAKTRGCVSRAGILAMVFKLAKSAEQRWRKLKGAARLAQVIDGVRFKDGLQEEAQRIAA